MYNGDFDIRAVTLSIDILDCHAATPDETINNIIKKIRTCADALRVTATDVGRKYGIPVVHTRITITPISDLIAGFNKEEVLELAIALDRVVKELGVSLLGGFRCNVEGGIRETDELLILTLPEILSKTNRICASVNVGSSRSGINMDAVSLIGRIVKLTAEKTASVDGFGCAKFVVYCNQPVGIPFFPGSYHSAGESSSVINIGAAGAPLVFNRLQAFIKDNPNSKLEDLSCVIKHAASEVVAVTEQIGREIAVLLGVDFGIVDLSLAPRPEGKDSVGGILKLLGVDVVGAPGTTACLAMLNDAVKKGGAFATQVAGGLSGAFIPVLEDEVLAEAAACSALTIEKLEAMTAVCSVGLDMVAVPGDTTEDTISALIADQMAIGMINKKATAVRIIPVVGKQFGEHCHFGDVFGGGPIMRMGNNGKSSRLIKFAGRIPAPIHSLNG